MSGGLSSGRRFPEQRHRVVAADKRWPDLIAAAAFGRVQRRVSACDQFDEVMGGGRPGNDAEAHGNNAKLPDTVVRNCQFFDLAANTLGDANRPCSVQYPA